MNMCSFVEQFISLDLASNHDAIQRHHTAQTSILKGACALSVKLPEKYDGSVLSQPASCLVLQSQSLYKQLD